MSEICKRLLKTSCSWAFAAFSAILMFVPEDIFLSYKLPCNFSNGIHLLILRVILFAAVYVCSVLLNIGYLAIRWKYKIKGHNYAIHVEYGNLLKKKKCQKVINFDECFTTEIGEGPWQIKPNSVCGQYLQQKPIENMSVLISRSKLEPDERKNPIHGMQRYESGRLVPRDHDLLMAFAKLDENGHATMTRDEYLQCLDVLWKEIEKYSLNEDVCIPVLGAGRTGTGDFRPGQQEALQDAWKVEVDDIKNGVSRYDWTKDEIDELLLRDRTGKSLGITGYEGCHIKDVNLYEDLADRADNIIFLKHDVHIQIVHGGNTKNPSHWGEIIKIMPQFEEQIRAIGGLI